MADNNTPNDQQNQQEYPQEQPASQGQKKAVKVILIVVAVLAILGILGTVLLAVLLPKIGENIVEEATNSQIEKTDEGVTVESDDGESSFSVGADLPSDFPEIVPVFEPSDLNSSTSAKSGDDSKVWTATFITDASQNDVTSFYEEELSGDDWEVTNTFSSSDSSQTHYVNEAEQTRIGVIVQEADEDEGTTAFTLSVTQSQE